MNSRGWAYFVLLVGAAVACAVGLSGGASSVTAHELVAVAAFAALGVVSEAMAFNFDVRLSGALNSSVAYLPLFACAVLFPPFWTAVAGAFVAISSDLAVRRLSPRIAVFNGAQYLIALTTATTMYASLGGRPVSGAGPNVPAYFVLAATYFAVNMGLVSGFISVRSGIPIRDVLLQTSGPTGGNLLYDLLASPFGLLAAWLYLKLGIGGIFVGMLPLLLVRYSYMYAIQLRKANDDLTQVLIKAIETRDPYTSGHSIRVATLANTIGRDLGLPQRRLAMLKQAAILHDIGKIEALYATIISKPHDLTSGERAVIRSHAAKGADLLLKLSTFRDDDIIKGVRHHHERFDGSGYPDRLKGTDIPLFARIIMICDALDAMLSDRPYRPALDIESVRRELLRCSGEQFDPEIVRIVLDRGTLERARELVRQEPPDAMAHPMVVVAAAGK